MRIAAFKNTSLILLALFAFLGALFAAGCGGGGGGGIFASQISSDPIPNVPNPVVFAGAFVPAAGAGANPAPGVSRAPSAADWAVEARHSLTNALLGAGSLTVSSFLPSGEPASFSVAFDPAVFAKNDPITLIAYPKTYDGMPLFYFLGRLKAAAGTRFSGVEFGSEATSLAVIAYETLNLIPGSSLGASYEPATAGLNFAPGRSFAPGAIDSEGSGPNLPDASALSPGRQAAGGGPLLLPSSAELLSGAAQYSSRPSFQALSGIVQDPAVAPLTSVLVNLVDGLRDAGIFLRDNPGAAAPSASPGNGANLAINRQGGNSVLGQYLFAGSPSVASIVSTANNVQVAVKNSQNNGFNINDVENSVTTVSTMDREGLLSAAADAIKVASIAIHPGNDTVLPLNQPATFSATVTLKNGTTRRDSQSSVVGGVWRVNWPAGTTGIDGEPGQFYFHGELTPTNPALVTTACIVSYTEQGVRGEARIKARSDAPTSESITIGAAVEDLRVNGSVTFAAEVTFSDESKATGTGGTWSVTNGTGSARSVGGGVIQGVTAGTVTVTYEQGGVKGSLDVTVKGEPFTELTGVYPVHGLVSNGGRQRFEAFGKRNSTRSPILANGGTWSVIPGTGSGTIAADGTFTGAAAGTATVRYEIDGLMSSTVVSISNASPTGISLFSAVDGNIFLKVGEKLMIRPYITLSDGTAVGAGIFTNVDGIGFSRSNFTATFVNSTGDYRFLRHLIEVTAKAAGTSRKTWSASAGGVEFTNQSVTFHIVPDFASIAVLPVAPALAPGATQAFAAEITLPDNRKIPGFFGTWSVTPGTGSGTITEEGLFTAGSPGTVTVSCTRAGVTGSATVTVAAPKPAPPAISGITTGLKNMNQEFTVTGVEGATIEYALLAPDPVTGEGWLPYSGPVTLSEETSYTIYARQTVNGASSDPTSGIMLWIDKTAPAAPSVEGVSAGSTSLNQNLVVLGAEPGGTLEYSLDGGTNWILYESTVTLSEEGPYSITARHTDAAGNISASRSAIQFTIDKTKPKAPTFVGFSSGVFNTPQTLTIAGAEEGGRFWFNPHFNDESKKDDPNYWNEYTNPLPLGEELNGYTLYIVATHMDAAENISDPSEPLIVTMDFTAPASQNMALPGSSTVKGGTSLVLVSANEPGGSVWLAPAGTTTFSAGATMTTASGTATSINAPATAGDYVLYVIDEAGNISAASTAKVTVDNTKPAAPTVVGLTAGSTAASHTFTVTGAETGGTLEYSTNGGTDWLAYGNEVTLSTDGAYSVQARHTDAAGNVSDASEAIQVTVATAAPVTLALLGVSVPALTVGGNVLGVATATFSDDSTLDVSADATWNSSNDMLVMIMPGGAMVGMAEGVVTITAEYTSGGVTKSGSAQITVGPMAGDGGDPGTGGGDPGDGGGGALLESIELDPASSTIAPGAQVQFTATGIYGDASTATFSDANLADPTGWSVDGNPALPTGVSTTGGFFSDTPGTYTVRYTRDGVSGTATVTVTGDGGSGDPGSGGGDPATLVSLAITVPATLGMGEDVQGIATATYSDNSTRDVSADATWNSTDTMVVSTQAGGVLLGMMGGTATVSAEYTEGGVTRSDSILVTVGDGGGGDGGDLGGGDPFGGGGDPFGGF